MTIHWFARRMWFGIATAAVAVALGAPGPARAAAVPATTTAPATTTTTTTTTTSTTSTPAAGATGGTAVGPTTLPTPTLDPTVLVATGTITVRMRPVTLLGDVLNFRGVAPASDAGATAVIETLDAATGAWTATSEAKVGPRGQFVASWRTDEVGRVTVRATIAPATAARSRRARSARAAASSNPAEITVYQPARATYFGPGLYGQQTACGEVLTPSLIGVANRTLPCGTDVTIDYDGRSLTVPVVDRGPYANGADWDLTSATAEALGMTETETIGTIVAGAAATPSPAPTPAVTSPTGGVTAG